VVTFQIANGTFTLHGTASDTAQSVLSITGGNLTGAGTFAIGGALNWSNGNINTAVSCAGGSINVADSSTLGDGGQLINSGALTWTPNSGPRTGNSTVISNASTGVITVAFNGNNIDSYAYGGTTAFYNAGTINVSGDGMTGSITDPFFNTGTVNIQSGTLEMLGGGTEDGTFIDGSGATLELGGGAFTFNSNSTISGAGDFVMGGGSLTENGGFSLGGSWTINGGSANLAGTSTAAGYALSVLNGGVSFNGVGP
jgi:hypothetical protein